MKKPYPFEVYLTYEIHSSWLPHLLVFLPYDPVRNILAKYFTWKTRRKYIKHTNQLCWIDEYEKKVFVESALELINNGIIA